MAKVEKASVNTEVSIDDKPYSFEVGIPKGTPTAAAPYEFKVAQKEHLDQPLLALWIGGGDNVELQISPPSDLLPKGGSFAINSVAVEVISWADDNYPSKRGATG